MSKTRRPGIGRLHVAVPSALLAAALAWGAVAAFGHSDAGPLSKSPAPNASASRATAPPSSEAATSTNTSPSPIGISGSWKLILNSVFDGTSLDHTVWRQGWFGSGTTGPINALEAACYKPGNVSFPGDQTMHLNVTGTPSACKGKRRPYTGSVVTTNPKDGRSGPGFEYRYGVLETKVYVPGQGALLADWPAVTTFGQLWPQDGEDDILEVIGGAACFHFHSPGYAPSGHLGGCDTSITAGWHTFASDWQPGSVTYYYDGHEVGKIVKGVTSAPMYIVIVNTVPAKTPWVDRVDALRVAYVRVWQAN